MNQIKVNNVSLAYNDFGEGKPCLMLHGNRDCKNVFDELAPEISRQCHMHVYAIDFRGHGDSEKALEGYTIENFVEDIVAFIKIQKLDKVTIIGHSLGSTVAIALMEKYSEYVKQLVLMGASVDFKLGFKRPDLTEETYKKTICETNKKIGPLFFGEDETDIQNRIFQNWEKIPYEVHMNLIKLIHPNLVETAKKITCRTLLIYGEHDKITAVEAGEKIHQCIKNSELFVVPGAYHFMYLKEFKLVSDKIEEFLNVSIKKG